MSGLLWTWRMGLCVMFALFLAGMVAAQVSPAVQLTIEPTPSRGGTAWFDVRLQIPQGYFVPAESRGALKGAWLQPLPPFFSRPLPTYPIPDTVALPGSDQPLLAYSGTLVVRVPVFVGALKGIEELSVRFGYQLCDPRTCSVCHYSGEGEIWGSGNAGDS
jgi:hypothetical protein